MNSGGGAASVCCVIVNWNGWRDTLDCLSSLREQDYPSLQTIVVDNGSSDDSVERIREAFPEVRILETGRNLGFASGCNVGLREALRREPEWVWLLNNDTICPPDTLSKLVRTGKQNPDAGLIGTVLYFAHNPRQVQTWGGGRLIPWIGISRQFYHPAPFGRDAFVTFASALARRAMLQQVGLLYEGFFMYYDDGDLALRMQKNHWKIAMAEDTAVLHKEGGSVATGENPFMAQVITVSGLRFIRRNSPWAFIGMPVFIGLRIARRISNREWKELRAVLRGTMEFLRTPMPR